MTSRRLVIVAAGLLAASCAQNVGATDDARGDDGERGDVASDGGREDVGNSHDSQVDAGNDVADALLDGISATDAHVDDAPSDTSAGQDAGERIDSGSPVDASRDDVADEGEDSGTGDDAMSVDVVTLDDATTDQDASVDDVDLPGDTGSTDQDVTFDDAAFDAPTDESQDGSAVDDLVFVDAAIDAGDEPLLEDVPVDQGCPPSAPVMCGAQCFGDTDSNPAHCGDACVVCPLPDHGAAVCSAGACGIVCDPGYVAVGGTCGPVPPPRLVYPITDSTLSVRNPTLRWELPSGVARARISICPDRVCSTVVAAFDTSSASLTLPLDLPRGVWYWRAQSIDRGVASPALSATWEFHTPAVSGPVQWAYASHLDANSDGYDELAVGAAYRSPSYSAMVVMGNASRSTSAATLLPQHTSVRTSFNVLAAGDVDGDGFSDLGVVYGVTTTLAGIDLFKGTESGVSMTAAQTIGSATGPAEPAPFVQTSTGDFDRDGYSDMLAGLYDSNQGVTVLSVRRGSPVGWSNAVRLGSVPGDTTRAATGDFNADGFDDVVLAAGFPAATIMTWMGSNAGLQAGPVLAMPAYSDGFAVATGADIDGDGYLDAVVGTLDISTHQHIVTLLRGSATGLVVGPSGVCGGVNDEMAGMAGDVDMDGHADVAIRIAGLQRVAWCVWTGSGFALSPVAPVPIGCPSRFSSRPIGDWDGDGNADFAVTCDGVIDLFLGSSDPASPYSMLSITPPAGAFGGSIALRGAGSVFGLGGR